MTGVLTTSSTVESGLEDRQPKKTLFPQVSVITPFLNTEAFLAETIESVIAQTFDNWEYLLVDDGSDAAATTIAKDYAARYPERIQYLEHPGHCNRGISATRNLGVRYARGEFIAFLDSDDIWMPSKLVEQVAVLLTYPEVGMVCGTYVEWWSWSNGQDRTWRTGDQQNTLYYPPDTALRLYPLGPERAPSFSDVIFRAGLVRQLGGFDDRFTGMFEELVLLLKVYLSAPVYFCSSTSNKIRMHPASVSTTARREGYFDQSLIVFLEWVGQYISTIPNIDRRVKSVLHRKLRQYRRPRIHYLLSTFGRVRNKFRRMIARASRSAVTMSFW